MGAMGCGLIAAATAVWIVASKLLGLGGGRREIGTASGLRGPSSLAARSQAPLRRPWRKGGGLGHTLRLFILTLLVCRSLGCRGDRGRTRLRAQADHLAFGRDGQGCVIDCRRGDGT
ncbi:hypothetical protein ACFSHQ_20115 [Gemmobacter lanyuensis]